MESQQLFNFVVAVGAFLAVFVFNWITRKIQKLEDQMAELPKEYVAKEDYRTDIKEVKDILRQIFDRLENKQDKPFG